MNSPPVGLEPTTFELEVQHASPLRHGGSTWILRKIWLFWSCRMTSALAFARQETGENFDNRTCQVSLVLSDSCNFLKHRLYNLIGVWNKIC